MNKVKVIKKINKKVIVRKLDPSFNKKGKKGCRRGETPAISKFHLLGKTFFLTYKGTTDSGVRLTREDLVNFLVYSNPRDRKLHPQKYLVCEQMYDDGTPHFHVILVYSRRKSIERPDYYDYLGLHPNIQVMRNMKAALQYVHKQDLTPLTNMDLLHQRRVSRARDSSSLYQLLEQQMLRDPFNFDVARFFQDHDLFRQVYRTNYSKAISLLRMAQQAKCNSLLQNRRGFIPIDRPLIEQKLSPFQLQIFDSWGGYQRIVDYLNTMNVERGRRQQKSLNLLITGPPSTGKSALFWQRDPLPGRSSVVNHLPLYPMGMRDWFPDYRSDVYAGIYWNQAKLTSYSYDVILQLLDGSPVMLPAKGGGHKKVDNPLVILISNMTLEQMIHQKFYYNRSYQVLARSNLAVRVQNLVLPPGYDLFLLQRLLVPRDPPPA